MADVISAPRVHKGYPAEKPVAVLDLLVRQSAAPGELVIDPFMGSGSTGLAAVNHGCRFAGNDIADAAVDLTRQRLDSLIPVHRDRLGHRNRRFLDRCTRRVSGRPLSRRRGSADLMIRARVSPGAGVL